MLQNWPSTLENWLNRFCENVLKLKDLPFLVNWANFQLSFWHKSSTNIVKFCTVGPSSKTLEGTLSPSGKVCAQGAKRSLGQYQKRDIGVGRCKILILIGRPIKVKSIGGLAVVASGDRHMGRLVLGRPGPVIHKEKRGKKGQKGRFNIFFNSIQFNLYFHIKNTQTSRNITITKKQNMEEKIGRPIRPDDCPSLKRKKIVTKHPINHMTKPNKTRRQNKGLCSKERNYS